MTPEEREILKRVEMLAEENNALLKKNQRSRRMGGVFRFLYWLVVIAISFGAYYYIQPYVEKMMVLYNKASSEINSIPTP